VSRRDGRSGEIYVMSADGGGLRRLTRNGLADALPIWSPNGTRIAFLRFSVPPGRRCEDGLSMLDQMSMS
jgi:Tol biopolymer transport system component